MANNRYHLFGIGLFAVTRTRAIILLAFLLFAGSSMGYAIWDNTDTTFDDNIIVIGDFAELSVVKVTENPDSDMRLVPYGAFKGSDDIDHYLYQYVVVFNQEGILEVNMTNLRISDNIGLTSLFRFAYATHENGPFIDTHTITINLSYDSHYYDETLDVFIVPIYLKVYFENIRVEDQDLLLENATLTFEVLFSTKPHDHLQGESS